MTRRSWQHSRKEVPFHMESKFIIGQLFTSTLMISMCANMLYNPTLGALVSELVNSKVVVVPIPNDFTGRTFKHLFEHMIRRKNLLLLALLRRQDEQVDTTVLDEDLDEEDEAKPPVEDSGDADRWQKGEPAWRRFVFTMPEGNRAVADHDGCLCIMANRPTTSKTK